MTTPPFVVCAWHQPKNAIVNRKTGEPITETVVRLADVKSHGVCYRCAQVHWGKVAEKVSERIEVEENLR
jgi:hypothetical protein